MADFVLDPPRVDDGADLWRLAAATTLDTNSPYAYLLVARDFGATSVVARDVEGVAGFVSAYRRPDDPETVFVWQVAVAERARRQGLAARMLGAVVDRLRPRGVRFLEATVTPSNDASARLFQGLARDLGAGWRSEELFPASTFPPGEPHEAELLVRIGPF